MKLFDQRTEGRRTVISAQDYAATGGQGLHVWMGDPDWPNAPSVFKREAKAGRPWAHLFDQDADRLVATAKRLGVRVIKIGSLGKRGQHIDLCGAPLEKAIAECAE